MWKHAGLDEWQRVHVAQIPGFTGLFDRAAPLELRPFAPPLLVALGETGTLQMWTGLLVRTAPGCNLLLREPVNTPRSKVYEICEILIQTDRQLAPLFVKIHLTRSNVPIEFEPAIAFAQAQPAYRTITEHRLDDFEVVSGLNRFTPEDWTEFRKAIIEPEMNAEAVPTSRAGMGTKSRSKFATRRNKR
jgi:hypothetical protein